MKRSGQSHQWYYRVPGRAPEHWDKIIEISILKRTYDENERHVRRLLRIMLGVRRLPNGTEVWPKTEPWSWVENNPDWSEETKPEKS